MANTLQEEFILNSDANIIVKYDIIGDGSGELGTVMFNNTSSYNKTVNKKLWKIEYELNGFTAALLWFGAPSLKQIITLESGHHEHVCWEWFGGYSNTNVSGANGDIYLLTDGLGDNERGYIILYLKNREQLNGTR